MSFQLTNECCLEDSDQAKYNLQQGKQAGENLLVRRIHEGGGFDAVSKITKKKRFSLVFGQKYLPKNNVVEPFGVFQIRMFFFTGVTGRWLYMAFSQDLSSFGSILHIRRKHSEENIGAVIVFYLI